MTSGAVMGNKVAVLGAGAWGTALAKVLADKGDTVQMYCRRPDLVALEGYGLTITSHQPIPE
jgi:glycerol-3-phosphate dehydrogenase